MSEVVGLGMDRSDEQKAIHAALELWARWSRTVLAAIGWPSSSIIARMIEYGPMGASHSTAGNRKIERDETCERIDWAVRQLDPTEFEVIVRTYLGNDVAQVTAGKCGLTYGYYRHILSRAQRLVGEYLLLKGRVN